MSPYSLYCSVCEDNFTTSDDWTKHLFGNDHQNKARLECAQWEDTRRECALVAFFSYSINSAVLKNVKLNGKCNGGEPNLLLLLRNHLLMNVNREESRRSPLLITDFVWWNEQPKMCILQFENREKVDQVYKKLNRDQNGIQNQHEIGDHLVQFKKLVDLLELEWRMLLPDSNRKSQKRPCTTTDENSPQQKKRRINVNNVPEPGPDIVLVPEISTPESQDLCAQYNCIIKSVQIPPQIYNTAIMITETIKAILSPEFPDCQVYLLRSYNLNIKTRLYADQNDILIFIQREGHKLAKNSKKLKISQLIEILVDSDQFQERLKISTVKTITNELDLDKKAGQRFELTNDNASPSFSFHLFTDLYFGVEVQLNRLLHYMCQFDLRCFPVISLMHYFCNVNSCYFEDPQLPGGNPLEWLFILFMSKKKLIPTVRHVLSQNHEPVWQTSEKRIIDIGFNDNDQKFLQSWYTASPINNKLNRPSEKSVLKLFQEFLNFMGNVLGYGNIVLNVRDAEILNRKALFSKAVGENVVLKTKLTEEEKIAIRNSPNHLAKWGKWPFSILHPLVVNLKLGFQLENISIAVKLMKGTGKELERFLQEIRKRPIELSSRNLESVLKIDDKTKKQFLKERLAWEGKRRLVVK